MKGRKDCKRLLDSIFRVPDRPRGEGRSLLPASNRGIRLLIRPELVGKAARDARYREQKSLRALQLSLGRGGLCVRRCRISCRAADLPRTSAVVEGLPPRDQAGGRHRGALLRRRHGGRAREQPIVGSSLATSVVKEPTRDRGPFSKPASCEPLRGLLLPALFAYDPIDARSLSSLRRSSLQAILPRAGLPRSRTERDRSRQGSFLTNVSGLWARIPHSWDHAMRGEHLIPRSPRGFPRGEWGFPRGERSANSRCAYRKAIESPVPRLSSGVPPGNGSFPAAPARRSAGKAPSRRHREPFPRGSGACPAGNVRRRR